MSLSATRNGTSGMDRCLALTVRFWAYNMTLIHARGTNWPGFRYSEAEKQELKSIADEVPELEFYAWSFLVAVIAVIVFGLFTWAGFSCLTNAIGGDQNMRNTPDALFYLMLGLVLLASFSIGFPTAMLTGSAIAGSVFGIKKLLDGAATAHYFRKLWFQITRMALVLMLALAALWLYLPSNSKTTAITKLVMPLVSPAVGALTIFYYVSSRYARKN